MIFQSVYLGSAWPARTSLMANSALLGSIPSRRCSASRLGSGELEARLLTAEGTDRLASFEPECVVIVAIGGFHWRPKALKQQHLHFGRLRFCGTCGLATILLPLTKSQPVGCVHNGGASSTPMSDTASGCSPLLCHC